MNIQFEKYITFESFVLASTKNEFEQLTHEITKYLNQLAFNALLSPIIYSEDHSTNFSYAWNHLVNQTINDDNKTHIDGDIKNFIQKLIIYNIKINSKDNITTEILKSSFDKFIDFLNTGNFNTYCTPEGECVHCGTKLKLIFKNWIPTFYEFKEIADPQKYLKKVPENSPLSFLNKMDYFPAEKCFTEFTQIKTFEFKTGNLLISDWFKLEEFTKNVEINEDIYHFNINCSKGRFDAFEHYFKQNFISVYSYSGLDMYSLTDKKMQDSFVFGKINHEKDESEELNNIHYKFEESVNSGLRATTIIEKETLIDIVNRSINNIEKATQMVNDYIKKNKDEIITKKVTPGEYTLIFDLNRKDLNDLMFPKNIPDNFNANIFLYPTKLTPSLNQKSKIKIK